MGASVRNSNTVIVCALRKACAISLLKVIEIRETIYHNLVFIFNCFKHDNSRSAKKKASPNYVNGSSRQLAS
jgi:hypothetical protein